VLRRICPGRYAHVAASCGPEKTSVFYQKNDTNIQKNDTNIKILAGFNILTIAPISPPNQYAVP